jgi:hypothetical protein
MKKIYAVFTAALFLSISAFSQQYYNPVTTVYTKSNVMLERNSKVQLNIIGNPATNAITLQISNPVQTKYELSLYSSTGKKVSTVLYEHPAGVSTKAIYVSQLQRGMYFLVALSKDERTSLQVVVQ